MRPKKYESSIAFLNARVTHFSDENVNAFDLQLKISVLPRFGFPAAQSFGSSLSHFFSGFAVSPQLRQKSERKPPKRIKKGFSSCSRKKAPSFKLRKKEAVIYSAPYLSLCRVRRRLSRRSLRYAPLRHWRGSSSCSPYP